MNTPKYIKHFFIAVLLFAIQAFVYGQGTEPVKITLTYATPGTYTFAIPSNPTNETASGQLWGGGGGSGGAKSYGAHTVAGGGGGGGGGYSVATNLSGTLTIVVGAGGTGGFYPVTGNTPTQQGQPGGQSKINAVVANGGGGGTGGFGNSNNTVGSGTGGAGGTGNTANGSPGTAGVGNGLSGGNLGGRGGDGGGAGNGGGTVSYFPIPSTWLLPPALVNGFLVDPGSFTLGPPPSSPGGGAPGPTSRANPSFTESASTALNVVGQSGANGQVKVSFWTSVFVPTLTGPSTTVCEGEQFQFGIADPVLGTGVIYNLFKKTSGGDVWIATLSAPGYTYTEVNANHAQSGTYYLRAEYDFNVIAAGATSIDPPGALFSYSDDFILTVIPASGFTPRIFWSFNNICPIDEHLSDEICVYVDALNSSRTWNICTGGSLPNDGTTWWPDSLDHVNNYFANYIDWDSIVYVPGYPLFPKEDFIWWDAPVGGNILKENGILTAAGLALQAMNPPRFVNFWQNLPSKQPETYWVSINDAGGGACGGPGGRLEVFVNITDGEPHSEPDVCQTFYTSSSAGAERSWPDIVGDFTSYANDGYQGLLWFKSFADGDDYFWDRDRTRTIPEPDPVDLTVPSDTTFWAIRVDDIEDSSSCITHPFSVHVNVLESPRLWINAVGNDKDTLCVGTNYNLVIQFAEGIAPFDFAVSGFDESLIPEPVEDFIDSNGLLTIPMGAASIAVGGRMFSLTSTTIASAALPCLQPDSVYHTSAQLFVFDKPQVNLSASPVCEGNDLSIGLTYTSNSGSDYTSGWLLGGVPISPTPNGPGGYTYPVTTADNGKELTFFVENRCEKVDPSVTVVVNTKPNITLAGNTVCSGDSLLIDFNGGPTIQGVSNVPGVAFHSNGHIKTVEGMDGVVTFTFTSGACILTEIITVTPRTQTPTLRWNYNSVCPIDEGEASYSPADSLNILTPWNPGGVYFANHVMWDSLVVNSVGADIPLSQIKWYRDQEMTDFIRTGWNPGDDVATRPPAVGSGLPMANFWQNEPHPLEVYWATITTPDSCESRPIRVTVYILDDPGEIAITDIAGYVQPSGTINYESYFNLGLDDSQFLEWYSDDPTDAFEAGDQTAIDALLIDPAPEELDLTTETDITYWIVRADDFGCRSQATPFRVHLFPMPVISILPSDTTICAGGDVNLRVKIEGGTPLYNFQLLNIITNETIDVNDFDNTTIFTLPINPTFPATYVISEFSDLYTDTVTISSLGLFPPATYDPYFYWSFIRIMTAEISTIVPSEGPVLGGTFTGNPSDPVDLTGTVTITGFGFNAFGVAPMVTFGGVYATNVTVNASGTIITCTPPPHPPGLVTVSVITACGPFSLTDGYKYSSMDIASISPAYAAVTGGDTITIKGSGFLAAIGLENDVEVYFCGVLVSEIVSVTNSEIVCITGASNYARHGDIKIFNGSETSVFTNYFTYYPVKFIRNGLWSDHTNWDKHTNDSIIPYPGARVHIMANCLQDTHLQTGGNFPYEQAMDSITVYPNKAYTLGNGNILDANVFVLKDDASFLNFGTMQATLQNVEHRLIQGRNWYVSSPMLQTGTPTDQIIDDALGKDTNGGDLTYLLPAGNWRVEWYEEDVHNWQRLPLGSSLITGQGYTVFSANRDIALKYSGTYNDGNRMSPGLTRQNDAHPKRGFNLVGNPFPSYWRWTESTVEELGANVYSTIWYRTVVKNGIYEFWSYNASGNVEVMPGWEDATPTGSFSLGYIPPMQAFWVRLLDGQNTGTLNFRNDRRAHADHGSNILKSAGIENTETRPLLRIAVTNGVRADETVIYADARAKNEFDTYDSDKWFTNQGVEIFTQPAFSTRELVINGLSEIVDGTEVPLGFQAEEGGAFSFRAKEILNLDALEVFLCDKWRNLKFDLRNGDYNFTSSSAPVTDRFSIVFRRTADNDLDADTGDNLLAYSGKNGEMIVLLYLKGKHDANVSVFDVAGRKITEQSVVVGERTTLKGTFPKGVYILRAGKYVTKIQISSNRP